MGDTNSNDITIKAMDQAFEWTRTVLSTVKFPEGSSREDLTAQFAGTYEAVYAAIRQTAYKGR